MALNQDNESEWCKMFVRGMVFQRASTIQIKLRLLIEYKADISIIPSQCNFFSPWYSRKTAHLALNNNQSLWWQLFLNVLTNSRISLSFYLEYNIVKIFFVPTKIKIIFNRSSQIDYDCSNTSHTFYLSSISLVFTNKDMFLKNTTYSGNDIKLQ